jgi:hypothetical protein
MSYEDSAFGTHEANFDGSFAGQLPDEVDPAAANPKSAESACSACHAALLSVINTMIAKKRARNYDRSMKLSKPWSPYRQIIIETYRGPPRGNHGSIRARPIAGQFFSSTMNVECSRDMRKRFAVGTRFRIFAKEVLTEDGTSFLYTHFSWPYEPVS